MHLHFTFAVIAVNNSQQMRNLISLSHLQLRKSCLNASVSALKRERTALNVCRCAGYLLESTLESILKCCCSLSAVFVRLVGFQGAIFGTISIFLRLLQRIINHVVCNWSVFFSWSDLITCLSGLISFSMKHSCVHYPLTLIFCLHMICTLWLTLLLAHLLVGVISNKRKCLIVFQSTASLYLSYNITVILDGSTQFMDAFQLNLYCPVSEPAQYNSHRLYGC